MTPEQRDELARLRRHDAASLLALDVDKRLRVYQRLGELAMKEAS